MPTPNVEPTCQGGAMRKRHIADGGTKPQILQCTMTPLPRPPTTPSSGEAKKALAWAHSARFLTTASQLEQLPASELPEIAFVGRSNAGKSTAINRLAQQKRLAFASRTPGRTQHINLFAIGPKESPDTLFADLPGYGYAAVERSAKLRWQAVMAEYLQLRRPLHGVVLLVDSRLGLTELDQRLLALIAPRLANGEVRLLALLTKADKLNRREGQAAVESLQAQLGDIATESADLSITLFSALSGLGLPDVAETLHGWTHPDDPAL
jgi:GTP-binding protein